jgi:hypothetical protein
VPSRRARNGRVRAPSYHPGSLHRDRATAEATIRELFESIHASRYVGILVPHGFALAGLRSEERENPFAAALRYVRVNATIDAPVVYQPLTGRAHTADREILATLKLWIEELPLAGVAGTMSPAERFGSRGSFQAQTRRCPHGSTQACCEPVSHFVSRCHELPIL